MTIQTMLLGPRRLGVLSAVMMMACETPAPNVDATVSWAVNIGGPEYVGVDGTLYQPDEYVHGGEVRALDEVLGTQDPALYRSYRQGDISIARPLADGLYDISFHFAEPDSIEGGERVFDALIGGRRVIEQLDVMLARDGRIKSALTVTVPDVAVTGGQLEIDFEASDGEPLLSALVVRRKAPIGDWQLVWSDEFDARGAPDPRRWNVDLWPARKVNDEDQAYTDRPKNLRVEDGHLVIEAHKENYRNADYTSARIHSKDKGDILYGRVEVRAQLPRGKGTWPAIWMLPSDPFRYATNCSNGEWQGNPDCNAWPNSGEIDIMEHVGYQMNHVHGTVHTEAYYWAKWNQHKGRVLLDEADRQFHVYALEWSPQRIDIFVDDTLYFSYMNENEGWQAWPFDAPFHLILNVAVGGMWGRAGGGIDDEIFPQRMLVDYVRVYRTAKGASGST